MEIPFNPFEKSPSAPESKKIETEMEAVLRRVPKIEGTFDPDKEVKKLLSAPREQRKKTVAKFRDKLARQREAWALCRTFTEEKIEANPDISRKEMLDIIGQFASNYGFAERHIRTAERLIDGYIEQRKRTVEIRRKFPDNIELIKRLTRVKFTQADKSDFAVEVGPMSLEISCSGFNAGRIYERLKNPESKDPVVGFKYGGFSAETPDAKPVYYLVVNKDYTIEDPEFHATVVFHEREHQKNRILSSKIYGISGVRADVRKTLNRGIWGFLRHQVGERLFGFERNFENEILQRYESARAPEEKAFLLEEYMRLRREHALNEAKDEIIALKAIPGFTRYNKCDIFLDKGGPCDYLAELRNCNKKKDDTLWQETAQRMLVDEYGDIIDSAIAAFDDLVRLGYTRAEVIAMLSDKRLSDWPKTVRRLREEKQSKG